MGSSWLKFNVRMKRTVVLTTAGHEAIYLVWAQIVEVLQKAPSVQVLSCRALKRWLDHIFWTRHHSVVASVSCPGAKKQKAIYF